MNMSSRIDSYSTTVLWYILFGALHECTHWFVAKWVTRDDDSHISDNNLSFWYHILLGRQFQWNLEDMNDDIESISKERWIRHSGWIVSVFMAYGLSQLWPRSHPTMKWAAWITAMEAVWTDALGGPVLANLLAPSCPSDNVIMFACGNFGMLLLHHAWFSDDKGREAALDLLQDMIRITMMRGAQSGGVVCFHPGGNSSNKNNNNPLVGVRTRVLNRKRTDLSVWLRRQVARDNFGWMLRRGFPKSFTPVFSGHTRFATSSKATFDATHPLQWTPPTNRRVYSFAQSDDNDNDNPLEPQLCCVSNFVTHNGDLDYYHLNGQAYQVDQVQTWLERVLHHARPAPVDSSAIAGLVDLTRTRGCFGLSARYTVYLGLPTSEIKDHHHDNNTSDNEYPTYATFEAIGLVFEHVLQEMLKTTGLTTIEESEKVRESFARRVETKLQQRLDLLTPLEPFLVLPKSSSQPLPDEQPPDEEEQEEEESAPKNSVLAFCVGTVSAFFDNDLLETVKRFLSHATGSFGLTVMSSLDAHRQVVVAARGQTMSISFFPLTKIVLYGSELAAVKAGMVATFPGTLEDRDLNLSGDQAADMRLDLDDLSGEVVLLDYGSNQSDGQIPLTLPNKKLVQHKLMNGAVTMVLFQESQVAREKERTLYHRMVRLSKNKFIRPIPGPSKASHAKKDLILQDVRDIAKVCCDIQDDWQILLFCNLLRCPLNV